MKRIKAERPMGLASEMIIEQMNRTQFWFRAFVVATIAFIISCIRAIMHK